MSLLVPAHSALTLSKSRLYTSFGLGTRNSPSGNLQEATSKPPSKSTHLNSVWEKSTLRSQPLNVDALGSEKSARPWKLTISSLPENTQFSKRDAKKSTPLSFVSRNRQLSNRGVPY